jgi:hypothetical protein
MGWSISCLWNSLEIPEECGAELESLDLDLDGYSPCLEFVEDHMEHMDCLWREDVQAILAKHKVSGRVTFGSLEGDNGNEFWGYEWTDGELKTLNGKIDWKPD